MADPDVNVRINAEGPNKRLQDVVSDLVLNTETEADAVCWMLQVELAWEIRWSPRPGFYVKARLSEHQPGKPR